jgi:hypothetical protein
MYQAAAINFQKFSSTQKFKRTACSKVRLRDKDEAVRVLHKLTNRRSSDMRDFGSTNYNQTRAYQCDKCRGYHLTSSDTWDSRKRAA